MAIHIDNLSISQYRSLKDLEFLGLNHINIITGKNNAGKSSVLELISTLVAAKQITSVKNA